MSLLHFLRTVDTFLNLQEPQTLPDNPNILWNVNLGFNAKLTLGGNRIVDFSGLKKGDRGIIEITQDATGSRTLTLPASSIVIGTGAAILTLDTTPAATNVIEYYYSGVIIYWELKVSGGGGGGGGVSIPANQIAVGNGTGVAGSSKFTRNTTTGQVIVANSQTDLGTYRTDVESMFIVSRSTDPAINTNAHAIVDASLFKRTNNSLAYNSFTANVTFYGSATYNHYAAFQSAFAVTDTAAISNYYGLTDNVSLDAGTSIAVRYGVIVNDGVGSGTIGDQYGLYVPTLSKGTSKNYAIGVQSNDSNFGGDIRFTTSGSAANALTPKLSFWHATSYRTAYIVDKLEANSSRLQFYVSPTSLAATLSPLEISGDNGDGTGTGTPSVIMNARVMIGSSSYPTSYLHLGLGSTVAGTSPIKFVTASAALLTTPEAGAFETDGTDYYLTNNAGTRKKITLI